MPYHENQRYAKPSLKGDRPHLTNFLQLGVCCMQTLGRISSRQTCRDSSTVHL